MDNDNVVNLCNTVFSRIKSGSRNNNFQFSVHFGTYANTVEQQMSLINLANAGGYRDHPVGWPEFQGNGGNLSGVQYVKDIATLNTSYAFTNSINTPHLGCETYTGSDTTPPASTLALKKWGTYNVELLKATGVKRAEIWNEPQLMGITPKQYVALARKSITEIKNYKSSIKVGVACLANPFEICSDGANCKCTDAEHYSKYGKCYFNSLIKEGLLDLDIDAITLHYYNVNPNVVSEQLKYYRDLLDSKGKNDVEIWVTEYGWFNGTATGAKDEKYVAELIVKGYAQAMSAGFADSMCVYDLVNDSTKQHNLLNPEQNFGTVEAVSSDTSETGVAMSAKKSYIAIAAMNAILANAIGCGEVVNNDNLAYCPFEAASGEDILVAWKTDKKSSTIELTTTADSIMVYDIYGNENQLNVTGGKVQINLDSSVKYIKGNLGSFSIKVL